MDSKLKSVVLVVVATTVAALGVWAVCGDLALTSVLAKPSAGLGTTMIVTDTTANVHATCTSAVTTTAFWLSATSNGVSICNLGTHTTPGLPPGSNWVMSKLVTICSVMNTGNLWLVDVADRDRKTADNNYSNNTNSRPITITP